MTDAGINMTGLAEILSIPNSECSVMLKYELAVKEQNELVARIREWDALRKGAWKNDVS